MVKRYVAEPESDVVRVAMADAEAWFICRAGYVEARRAIGLAAGVAAAKSFDHEWPAFGVVEIDQTLAEDAATLAIAHRLSSLDSIHLAAALLIPVTDLLFATWDRRLHRAAGAEGLAVIPEAI